MLLFYKSIPLHKHILQIALLDIRSQKHSVPVMFSMFSIHTPLWIMWSLQASTLHTQTHSTYTHSVTQTLTTIKASCPFNIHSLHTHMLSYISLFISFFLKFFFLQFFNKFWVSSSNYHLQTGHFLCSYPMETNVIGIYVYVYIYK